MTGYVTQGANDGETIMRFDFHHARDFMSHVTNRYAMEGPQPGDDGDSVSEHDTSVFRSLGGL